MSSFNKKAVRKQVTVFEVMQKLDESLWNWSDDEKKKHFINSKSVMARVGERIYNGLREAGASAEEYKIEFCGIEHDKDVTYDAIKELYTPVESHVHIVITLKKKRDLNVIAKWVGVEPQYIDVPKGRYGKENKLAYLIHAKDPDKYQYSPHEVETFGTFDYVAYAMGKKSSWDARQADVKSERNKEKVEQLKQLVLQGLIEMEDIFASEDWKYVYAEDMRRIDDAFTFRSMDKGYETVRALGRKEFELSVYFITGESNAGKSHAGRLLCKYLEELNGWRTFETAPTHPLDGYNSEEIMLIDEARPYTYSAANWILMLDSASKAVLPARYKGKMRAYRTIIITSPVEDPFTFFNQVRGDNKEVEPLNQFIRRLNGHIHVVHAGDGQRYAYLNKIGRSEKTLLYTGEEERGPGNTIEFEELGARTIVEKTGGQRKVDFELVPFSEGISSGEIGEFDEFGLPTDIMREPLREIKYNNDPNVKHTGERLSVSAIQGQRKMLEFSKTLDLDFGYTGKDDNSDE